MEWLAGGRLGLLVEGTRQFDPAASDKSRSIIIPSWLISGADAGGEDFAYSRVASPPFLAMGIIVVGLQFVSVLT